MRGVIITHRLFWNKILVHDFHLLDNMSFQNYRQNNQIMSVFMAGLRSFRAMQ